MTGTEEGNTGNGKRRRRCRWRKTPDDRQRRRLEAGQERAKLIWAVAHPMRRRVLRTLADSNGPHSPTWLANTLDIPLGTSAYHVTILRKFGAVELADEQTAHGATKSFYLPKPEDDPPIGSPIEDTREVDEEDTRGNKG